MRTKSLLAGLGGFGAGVLAGKLFSSDKMPEAALSKIEFDTKIHLIRAISKLPKDVQNKFQFLLKIADGENLGAFWVVDLANKAIIGELEKSIVEQHNLGEKGFEKHLNDMVEHFHKEVMRAHYNK